MKVFLVLMIMQGGNMTIIEKKPHESLVSCELQLGTMKTKYDTALTSKIKSVGKTPLLGCIEELK